MELFSEVYGCYYQVLRHLLSNAKGHKLSELQQQIMEESFGESMLYMIPKLESGEWNLFTKEGELFYSKIREDFAVPISKLQKSYLKALIEDARICLFLENSVKVQLENMLADTEPLWQAKDFYYFDRFSDGDPFAAKKYRQNFRYLLQAIKNRQYVDIDYESPRGNRVHHHYLPCRLEYSVKNNKFRLLAIEAKQKKRLRLEWMNLGRMQYVLPLEEYAENPIDLNALIQNSYYKEPLRLRIINKRNALERAMLHFANYEKNTTKIGEDTYECLIYYNQNMETELLIEVMSFGPMLTVLGNDRFLELLKTRLQKQRELTARVL